MRTWTTLLIAAPVAVGLLAAPAAHADWHQRGGWGGDAWDHDQGGGGALAGALVGLGIGALIGGAIVASQPPYYYAPPPVVYAPPPPYYQAYPPPPPPPYLVAPPNY